jgi:RNA polymerase sigma factor (sigma-70 family)
MAERDQLAERFEACRPHLRSVAYRMLGSLSDAEDAVQETWLRLSRSDTDSIENLQGWLTTVVGRICLDMLRSRNVRREQPFETYVPDPIVSRADGGDPEQDALLVDSVGLAMMVVLDALSPAERLAFVLHDMFDVPFDDIAPIVERTPTTTRQLASRARRRVQDSAPAAETNRRSQQAVVDAFLAASRQGDFMALLAVLDPDIVLRADGGSVERGISKLVRGAQAVASQAVMYSQLAPFARSVLVNGVPGFITVKDGKPISILGLTVSNGKLIEMNILADPDRLSRLDLPAFSD